MTDVKRNTNSYSSVISDPTSLANKATQVYDQEYFSSTQAAIYIGDVWVDEIVDIAFQVTHLKTPIYGYASRLYDAVSKGPKLVRGSFRINLKEAGYLHVVLDRWARMRGITNTPFTKSGAIKRSNIERIYEDNNVTKIIQQGNDREALYSIFQSLGGFSSERQEGNWGIDTAEKLFESFEDEIWKQGDIINQSLDRGADDPSINGFDIFVQLGDWTNDLANHTVLKICDVHINGDQVVIDGNGQPILREYSFLARNLV